MATVTTSVKNLVALMADAVGAARTQYVSMSDEFDALRERRRALEKAPLNQADTLALMRREIEAQQQAAVSHPQLAERWKLIQRDAVSAIRPEHTTGSQAPITDHWDSYSAGLVALLLDTDQVMAKITPALDALDFTDCGPAVADRLTEMQKIERRMAALTAGIEEAKQALASAGAPVVDPHAPIQRQPGDEALLDGVLHRWATVNGTSYGWIAV